MRWSKSAPLVRGGSPVATKPGDELLSHRIDQTKWPRFTGVHTVEELSLIGSATMPEPTQIEDSA
jgi:hypothetical protein